MLKSLAYALAASAGASTLLIPMSIGQLLIAAGYAPDVVGPAYLASFTIPLALFVAGLAIFERKAP